MTKRFSWLLIGVAALCAALVGFFVARELDSSAVQLASGTWLPRPKPIPEFALTDQQGQAFTLHNLQGKPSLVFFGFTHCPDVCPTTLAKLAQVKKMAVISGLQVLLVSVDPQRDTPAAMSTYVHAFDPDFIGVTGDPKSIEKLTAELGIAIARVDLPGGDYTVDHSALVFLVNPQGQIVALWTPPFDTRAMAKDLQIAAPHLGASS
jgi:protein SCO1/2